MRLTIKDYCEIYEEAQRKTNERLRGDPRAYSDMKHIVFKRFWNEAFERKTGKKPWHLRERDILADRRGAGVDAGL